MAEPITFVFEDLGFAILASFEESYRVDFKIYEIFGREFPNPQQQPGTSRLIYPMLVDAREHHFSPETTHDLAEAQSVLEGYIKFDDSQQWKVMEEDALLFLSSAEEAFKLGAVMAKCHELASAQHPEWGLVQPKLQLTAKL